MGIDIGSGNEYPSPHLSNFYPHSFSVRWYGEELECGSMEGFLQGLKFADPEMQRKVSLLSGTKAKYRGKRKKWYKTQTLYWLGTEFNRSSDFYTKLMQEAFFSLCGNRDFRDALLETGNETLTHSLGRNKKEETVLTESEFCSLLTALRDALHRGPLLSYYTWLEKRKARDTNAQH